MATCNGHRSWLTLVLVAAALVAVSGIDAWSQSARPIRVVLPFAPGGPADAMARLLAEQIGSAGGPTMVVETRPGAGTETATEYVSRADPDGKTLLIISPSFVVLPHLRKLNYDPLTDFAPICELAEFPPLIVVNSRTRFTARFRQPNDCCPRKRHVWGTKAKQLAPHHRRLCCLSFTAILV